MKIFHKPTKTTLTISLGFLACFFLFEWKWAIGTALAVVLISLFSPFLSRKIEQTWSGLSQLLSLIAPNILLTAIFFLFLTPLAFFSRLFGKKDPLQLRPTKKSTWHETDRPFEPSDFEKTW
ncbi:MAG: hypothetical protein H6563_03870 [Lewinellaceae bacterium]|nr:hypothetical protein [Lewinellaceae bacterium]